MLGGVGILHNIVAAFYPSLIIDEHMVDRYNSQWPNMLEESGYFHIQATKPDTVGEFKIGRLG